jgi:signal transduction histidine kinase
MAELVKLTDPAARLVVALRKIDDLEQENHRLEGSLATCQLRLRAEQEASSDEQLRLIALREANQNLVLATFSAEEAHSAAEANNRRQTEFLSMLAHELRNPMASIAVAGNVILSLKIEHPRLGKLLAIVRRQIDHLLRLVDDLLDVSRISIGKISLQSGVVMFSDVIDSALETAHGFLVKQAQTADVTLPAEPVYLSGDLVRLAQLFSNLLINASKFSAPCQTIYVSAAVNQGQLEVTVRDHGKGIAPEFQTSIFDLFAQGPQAREHAQAGGLGIGLALVKTVAQMHGGAVRVESEGDGRGSAFIVTLPLLDQVQACA